MRCMGFTDLHANVRCQESAKWRVETDLTIAASCDRHVSQFLGNSVKTEVRPLRDHAPSIEADVLITSTTNEGDTLITVKIIGAPDVETGDTIRFRKEPS